MARRKAPEPANPWPFGDNPRAIEAYSRAHDLDRAVRDLGHGVRIYPKADSEKGRGYVIDATKRTCSNDSCRTPGRDQCVHLWEDDFRFGKYRCITFSAPAQKAAPSARVSSTAYAGVGRSHARPNPIVDGLRAATRARHARQEMPIGVKQLAADLAHYMRTSFPMTSERRRGRPKEDIFDIAIIAAFRALEGWTYEQLHSQIPLWFQGGLLQRPFAFGRLVETMTSSPILTAVLDSMSMRIEEYFRDVCTVWVTDGVIFSTARSDNARTSRHASGKSVRIVCHSQYEQRWGLLTGFRLTWSQRGRGSGEAAQYPYISRMTHRIFKPQFDLADAAFSTDRNFAFADTMGYRLLSPIIPSKFRTETKRFLTPARAEFHLAQCNAYHPGPLMAQIYSFRSKAEGWHDVVREQTKCHVVSRPERSRMPSTRSEDTKRYPERCYVGLPDDQAERDRIIDDEQFVGRAVLNEFHARRLGLHLHALLRAMHYYRRTVDFFEMAPFRSRPEDEAYSVFRARDLAA